MFLNYVYKQKTLVRGACCVCGKPLGLVEIEGWEWLYCKKHYEETFGKEHK